MIGQDFALRKQGEQDVKKKLMLKKDTLRDLALQDLKHVVGASDTSNPTDTCPPPAAGASGICDDYVW